MSESIVFRARPRPRKQTLTRVGLGVGRLVLLVGAGVGRGVADDSRTAARFSSSAKNALRSRRSSTSCSAASLMLSSIRVSMSRQGGGRYMPETSTNTSRTFSESARRRRRSRRDFEGDCPVTLTPVMDTPLVANLGSRRSKMTPWNTSSSSGPMVSLPGKSPSMIMICLDWMGSSGRPQRAASWHVWPAGHSPSDEQRTAQEAVASIQDAPHAPPSSSRRRGAGAASDRWPLHAGGT